MRRVIGLCVVLAGASLVVSATPSFDAWGWVLWGRELAGHGTFSTADYPSWKPLPALVTTVLATLAPGREPALWLVTARAGGLVALVLAGRLAARFGGPIAGVVAAAGLAAAPEWWSMLGAGSSEPLLVALVLGALLLHLEGRTGLALSLGVMAALLRPETWPFLIAFALWTSRGAGAGRRAVTLGALAVVPVLWFGGDWLGSGSPWTGGRLARVSQEAQALGAGTLRPAAALLVMGRGVGLVAPPLLVGVLVAVAGPDDPRRRALRALAAGALALIALVAGEAALGYAGLGRFALPAGALLCAVGAVGLTELVRRIGHAAARRSVVAAAVVVAGAAGIPAAVAAADDLRAAEASGDLAAETRSVLRDLQASGVLVACRRRLAVAPPSQPAVAVALGRPVPAVAGFGRARLVISPAGTARWPEVRRWLRRHPARRSIPIAEGLLVYDVCGPARRARAAAVEARPARLLLGRSYGGRPIVAVRAGDPSGPRVLVVGAIHGTEVAGIAIARALERTHAHADVWIVPNLNPDGTAAGTRQNGRGVDLNANWSSQWHGGGRPGDVYYPGSRPFSERETRIARDLILRVRPRVTLWFHQHMDVVWAWGPSSAAGRRYARAVGMRFYHHPWLSGTAANWQNHHLPDAASFTVELPAGRLSATQVRRHVRAVLRLAAHA
ncbi:MAG: hypothetical protein QOI62_172 [Solirubrobacteraceae bacterium]|jgi:hypothetical protein|nr:hypothetical protein [Solirubrobacteraceae bacterium]